MIWEPMQNLNGRNIETFRKWRLQPDGCYIPQYHFLICLLFAFSDVTKAIVSPTICKIGRFWDTFHGFHGFYFLILF